MTKFVGFYAKPIEGRLNIGALLEGFPADRTGNGASLRAALRVT
jgi:hypothetical protein